MTLDRLKAGERFPYTMLRYDRESVDAYWNWWWENRDYSRLDRPYTVADSDALLVDTLSKEFVDTKSESLFFPDILLTELRSGRIEMRVRLPRERFREQVVDFLASKCGVLESGPPEVVFTGGGYGAGKTTTLQFLVDIGKLQQIPGGHGSLQGVDYCKQLIPEFNCLKNVADGRASSVCQNESRAISDALFSRLLAEGKSFGWDSSMSNLDPTFEKLSACRKAGYRISLIAVETEPGVAARRAMGRAKETKRFAHPDFLLNSHSGFLNCLPNYWNFVDRAIHVNNTADRQGGLSCPKLVDEKAWC